VRPRSRSVASLETDLRNSRTSETVLVTGYGGRFQGPPPSEVGWTTPAGLAFRSCVPAIGSGRACFELHDLPARLLQDGDKRGVPRQLCNLNKGLLMVQMRDCWKSEFLLQLRASQDQELPAGAFQASRSANVSRAIGRLTRKPRTSFGRRSLIPSTGRRHRLTRWQSLEFPMRQL
jgi:hypothetical protein